MAESNVMGTAGTLVGAILESAGYHYQSYLLDVLKNPLENEVGGLIYLLGIAVAVFYTATQGGFKMTAYLMIGPPLFFAVIKVRGPIDDAKWEFGKSARNQAQVQEGVQKVAPNSGQANVSKLFGRYVQLVGTVNNEIINRLNKGRSGTDLWFVMKAELFTRIHTAR
ncbi:MAG TPA: hypothetical protein PLP17_16855, partial [Oligoflexia bacterium]|nr:hypothetical protein [Oligoflexia bacterium]